MPVVPARLGWAELAGPEAAMALGGLAGRSQLCGGRGKASQTSARKCSPKFETCHADPGFVAV